MTVFDYSALRAEVENFARTEVAVRPDLGLRDDFPADLWQAMGQSGLMAIAIPPEYGGGGGGHRPPGPAPEHLWGPGARPGGGLFRVGPRLPGPPPAPGLRSAAPAAAHPPRGRPGPPPAV
nr:acyl-CoA dehydrogenase family protein [Alphaproteobacteria bacterium]